MTQSDVNRAYRLATLAARIVPQLCQQQPTEAIKIAGRLLMHAEAAVELERDTKQLQELTEQFDEQHPARNFDKGVKIITGEKRPDRALPLFRRFLRFHSKTEKQAEKAMAQARAEGFTGYQVASLAGAFLMWHREYKSQQARKSREARKN